MKNGIWVKSWAASESILLCEIFGKDHAFKIKSYLGKNLGTVLHVFEKNYAVGYLEELNYQQFGKYVAKKFVSNPKILNKWIKDSRKATDTTLKFIKKNTNHLITKKEALEFFNLVSMFAGPTRPLKFLLDFLPNNFLNKYKNRITKARVYTDPFYTEIHDFVLLQAKKLAQKHKLDFKYLLCLTTHEFLSLLENSELPNKNILKQRYKSCVLVFEKSSFEILTAQTARKIINKISKAKVKNEISGVVAFKGLVKGKVKLVFKKNDFKKVKKGDIIISHMTRPEFLPIMKISSAFVTDAGGTLCHAAIAARELKKPCLIGTNFATKVFKDGDLVEVDANKGVVRRLN